MESLAEQTIELAKCLKNTSINVDIISRAVVKHNRQHTAFTKIQKEMADDITVLKMQVDFLQNQLFKYESTNKNLFKVSLCIFVISLAVVTHFCF
jgi:hypothetical protein